MSVDTLALARELKAAEIPAGHAEAIAAAIGRSSVDSVSSAATKADLAQAEARLETKMEQLRSTLMTWFIATNVTIAAIIIAVVKL